MKSVIFSIFLLSFLLPIAAALKCYHCVGKNSDTCQQEVIECPEGDQCVTTSEVYSFGGQYLSIFKGCSSNKSCDEKTYVKVNNEEYFTISTKCCNEDLCNNKFYEMPEDGEPRGYMCPNGYCPNTSEECEATGEMRCLTKEDQCINFSGTVKIPDGSVDTYSTKACASPQICKMEFSQLIGFKLLHATIYECNPPKPLSEDQKDKEKY